MEFACVVLSNVSFLWHALENIIHLLHCFRKKVCHISWNRSNWFGKCNWGSDIIFSDPANHKIYKYIIQYDKLEVFAGSGDENCIDGPIIECSFGQPCGIASEFNNGRCLHSRLNGRNCLYDLPWPITNTTKFLKIVGKLYKAFLVHKKGKTFDSFKITVGSRTDPQLSGVLLRKWTHHLPRCATWSSKNIQLNGPQGKVARKNIDSVRLFERGLSRRNETTKQYSTLQQICWAAWHLMSNTFILQPSSREKSCQCCNTAVLLETVWRKAFMCCHWSA